jgi:hypothetical protein
VATTGCSKWPAGALRRRECVLGGCLQERTTSAPMRFSVFPLPASSRKMDSPAADSESCGYRNFSSVVVLVQPADCAHLPSASSSKIGERGETTPCSFISSSPGFWLPSSWLRRCPICSAAAMERSSHRLDSRKRGRAGDIRLGIVCIAPGSDLIRRTCASSCFSHGRRTT